MTSLQKIFMLLCYKNILPLLCSNLVFRSLDFLIRAFFCASSNRLTLRSWSRSNGLLSWGLFFSSDALLFSFFWCMSMRDSDLFDSWKNGKKEEEIKALQNINNIETIQMDRLELGKLKIPEKGGSLVTVKQNVKIYHTQSRKCV